MKEEVKRYALFLLDVLAGIVVTCRFVLLVLIFVGLTYSISLQILASLRSGG